MADNKIILSLSNNLLLKASYNKLDVRNYADTAYNNAEFSTLTSGEIIADFNIKATQISAPRFYNYYSGIYHEAFRVDGDIAVSVADDKFILPGKDSDGSLPTPSSGYRGMLIRVEGGVGVADVTYQCLKSAAGTFSWVAVATG